MKDLLKYPFEKLMHVLAAVIPGFVALSIYHLANPGPLVWFWTLGSLGYLTKIWIVSIVALLIGSTINTLVSAILSGIRLVLQISPVEPQRPVVAPWRDPAWRAALSRVLPDPPTDSQLWCPGLHALKRKDAVDSVSSADRDAALAKVEGERMQIEKDDAEWERWYRHYHFVVQQPSDFVSYVQRGLQFNLETASLYALVSLFFVPAIRHWWCVAPAAFWVCVLVGTEGWRTAKAIDLWFTLEEQIAYLVEHVRDFPKSSSPAGDVKEISLGKGA